MAMRQIFELLDEEVEILKRLPEREGAAWAAWSFIEQRLNLDFNPKHGPIPTVERVGYRSIKITYSTRKMERRPVETF